MKELLIIAISSALVSNVVLSQFLGICSFVGVGTSVETAALNSKKALMRPVGSHNDNANAAKMEKLLEDGINAIGLGRKSIRRSLRCRRFG